LLVPAAATEKISELSKQFKKLMVSHMANIQRYFLAALVIASCAEPEEDELVMDDPIVEQFLDQLPNNFPIPNRFGSAASYGTTGQVELNNAFATPHGTNGRDCATCHAVESGWSINPIQIELMFFFSDGEHPIFNLLDANNPAADVSTPEARREAYSNLLRGLFRRGGAPRANAEYEIIAADDPNGYAALNRFVFFRRPLPTSNVHLITGLMWDDRLTVAGDTRPPRLGLFSQARGNITGGQQGMAPTDAIVNEIVDDELEIAHAQIKRHGMMLDSCGGRGGPEHLSTQPLVSGRWDLYDAWINLVPGSCGSPGTDRKRAQIARGQELFNEATNANGGRCRGCHNVVNNGTNINGTMFDIHVSDAQYRQPGAPLFTLRNRTTLEVIETTDPGKAFVTGLWSDMNRFKAPTLRGASARAPFFHNGMAETFRDVIEHYENELGFNFTRAQEDDLIAFLEAL
jgi:cytochrome c peroxidase